MPRAITKRQRQVLDFIVAFLRDNGYPPTIAEIGAEFGISSTNGVNDHLVALERKGYIRRSSKARGIQLTEKTAYDATGRVEEARFAPLIGRIAAGQPLLAEENIEGRAPLPDTLRPEVCYALRVHGDSMIEAGILDGDVILVDGKRAPRAGDIVVALVDDEATVKYYHPNGATIELRPANAAMSTLRYPARQVALQGVVAGLQRNYG